MEKYNKISSRMYKHIVKQKVQQKMQQKVQQKVHNNYVPLLIKRFCVYQVSGISSQWNNFVVQFCAVL